MPLIFEGPLLIWIAVALVCQVALGPAGCQTLVSEESWPTEQECEERRDVLQADIDTKFPDGDVVIARFACLETSEAPDSGKISA